MTRESAAGVMTVHPPALVETDSICRGSTDSIISGRAGGAAFFAIVFVGAGRPGAWNTGRSSRSSADHNHWIMQPFPGEGIRGRNTPPVGRGRRRFRLRNEL